MEHLPELTPHANLWIERNGQVVLSRWRIQLLQAVDEAGSISAAAERMQIQYRLAWERLDEMENGLGLRMVERHVGGAGGGGARLTAAGHECVRRYTAFADALEACLGEHFRAAFDEA